MSFTEAGKNAMLDEIGTVAVKMRLLDDADAEIVDHLDASQDQSLTWGSASGGEVSITNDPEFEVKSGVTVKSISFRSSDGNTEYARDVLAEGDRETFANNGIYTVIDATLTISDPA
jgi:hypothetical protein